MRIIDIVAMEQYALTMSALYLAVSQSPIVMVQKPVRTVNVECLDLYANLMKTVIG